MGHSQYLVYSSINLNFGCSLYTHIYIYIHITFKLKWLIFEPTMLEYCQVWSIHNGENSIRTRFQCHSLRPQSCHGNGSPQILWLLDQISWEGKRQTFNRIPFFCPIYLWQCYLLLCSPFTSGKKERAKLRLRKKQLLGRFSHHMS